MGDTLGEAIRQAGHRPHTDAFGVYLVTDTVQCGGPRQVVETAQAAARGGIRAVQLRDPLASTRVLVELAVSLKAALQPYGSYLIVNDRIDVALAAHADGVHVGQSDLPAATARRLMGPLAHIGLSISSIAELGEVLTMRPGTVDLLGVGPIRDTPSKPDAATATGFTSLRSICEAAPVPCVAIGGLTIEDVPDVVRSGAVGLAVISAICGHPDAEQSAAALVGALAEARGRIRSARA